MTARTDAIHTEARRNAIKREGMEAFLAGEKESDCPYPPFLESEKPQRYDDRRECWLTGWRAATFDRKHGPIFARYKQTGMCDDFCGDNK